MSIFRIVALLLFCLFPPVVLAADDCPPHPQCDDAGLRTWCAGEFPAVFGISVGSSLSSARETFGIPSDETSPRYDDVFLTTVINLEYEGLILEAIKQDGDDQFTISRIDSQSKQWSFERCPTVGDPREKAIAILGQPDRIHFVQNTEVLVYYHCPSDVETAVSVRNGTIIGILMWFDWV